jgi:hypothetical protein
MHCVQWFRKSNRLQNIELPRIAGAAGVVLCSVLRAAGLFLQA